MRWVAAVVWVMFAAGCGGKTNTVASTSAGNGASAGTTAAGDGTGGTGGGSGGSAGASGPGAGGGSAGSMSAGMGGAPSGAGGGGATGACVSLMSGFNSVSAGCCHDPCVEGEKCSVTFMNGGPQYKKCACSGGALVCCEKNQFQEVGCGAETECPALGAGAPCRGCCASRFNWMNRGCMCTGCEVMCPEACPGMAPDAVLSVGCATCLAGRIGPCQVDVNTSVAACLPLCGGLQMRTGEPTSGDAAK